MMAGLVVSLKVGNYLIVSNDYVVFVVQSYFSEFSTFAPGISNVTIEMLICCKTSRPKKRGCQLNPIINLLGNNGL